MGTRPVKSAPPLTLGWRRLADENEIPVQTSGGDSRDRRR